MRVSGTVIEYVPTADPNQLPLTEITGSPTVALLVHRQSVAGAGRADAGAARARMARWTSWSVSKACASPCPASTVVAPTGGNTNEPKATGTSNGLLNVVVTGMPRPFREPGIQAPDPGPPGSSIPPIPRWDFNPER